MTRGGYREPQSPLQARADSDNGTRPSSALERGIMVSDIISCIASGEIIEQYEDDKPFPSCLILGVSAQNKPIHVVVSEDGEFIYLITAYFPDESVWKSDYRTRKERSL